MEKYRASKLTIRKLSTKEERDFFTKYHLQGYISSTVCYGLFDGEELLQAESFGKPRIENQNDIIWHDWELLRECSKRDCQVYGGKSKLLKAFEEEYKPVCLLSYCNKTLGFDGHSYKSCGFTLEHISKDYYYEYNGERIPRYRMQKNANYRKAGKKEPIQITLEKYGKVYDPDLTEKQNAINAGFVFIRGEGQMVWTKYYSNDIGYIYKIAGPENKVYIGKHILRKDGELKKTDYWASGTYINNATKKYGKSAFKREVLYWTTDLFDLSQAEYDFISYFESQVGRENMYNIDFREKSATTNLWQFDKDKFDKSRTKQSKAMKDYWDNLSEEEYKIRCSDISKERKEYFENHDGYWNGKHLSEEAKQKISEKNKGKSAWNKGIACKEETKQKVSKSLKELNNSDITLKRQNAKSQKGSVCIKCLETGEIGYRFEWEAAGFTRNIVAAAKSNKPHRGYHFVVVEPSDLSYPKINHQYK